MMDSREFRDYGVIREVTDVKGTFDSLWNVYVRNAFAEKLKEVVSYGTGRIEEVGFQDDAVRSACREPSGIWSGEVATGQGKTVIAARTSLHFLGLGKKTLYVCPSSFALQSSIIPLFHKAFHQYGVSWKPGYFDDISLRNDVNFLTPWRLVRLKDGSPDLFGTILDASNLLVADEAHHYPDDPNGDLVVYGRIKDITDDLILRKKKAVALTATMFRMDGMSVLGRNVPDFRFTIQDAVTAGRCPVIFGLPVFYDVKAPQAKTSGDAFYDLNLEGEDAEGYWRMVTDVVTETYRRTGKPFCAFVRTTADCERLAYLFGEASGLGRDGLAVLTADTPDKERQRTISGIMDGRIKGYVTCHVGAESIDVPCLQVVHLIVRTRSVGRVVQSVGRCLRPFPGKDRVIVVDHNVLNERILLECNSLDYLARGAGVDMDRSRIVAGGPVVCPHGDYAKAVGQTLGEVYDIAIREANPDRSDIQENLASRKATLIAISKSGMPRAYLEARPRLLDDFLAFTTQTHYLFDQDIRRILKVQTPDWFMGSTKSSEQAAVDAEMREWAKESRRMFRPQAAQGPSKSDVYARYYDEPAKGPSDRRAFLKRAKDLLSASVKGWDSAAMEAFKAAKKAQELAIREGDKTTAEKARKIQNRIIGAQSESVRVFIDSAAREEKCQEKYSIIKSFLRSLTIPKPADFRALLMPCTDGPEIVELPERGVPMGNLGTLEVDPFVHSAQKSMGLVVSPTPMKAHLGVDHVWAMMGCVPYDLIYLDFFGRPGTDHIRLFYKIFGLRMLKPDGRFVITLGKTRCDILSKKLYDLVDAGGVATVTKAIVDRVIWMVDHPRYADDSHNTYRSPTGRARLEYATSFFTWAKDLSLAI